MKSELHDWIQTHIHDPRFIERYPHYAAVLARMVVIHDPNVSVMAVSLRRNRYTIHVNVDYFREHPEFMHGILLHEIHHVVLGHVDHGKFHAAKNPRAMELAMELSANEGIREPLPAGGLTLNRFQDLGVRPMQSTLERYHLITTLSDRLGRRLCRLTVDDHDPRGGWGVRSNVETCRSDSRAALQDVLRTLKRRRKGGRLAGLETGELIEDLLADTEVPMWKTLDWRCELERFVARMRSPGHSFKRPNRRFPERLGEIPGRIWSPNVVDPTRLLAAIDTSGSMTTEELRGIARQLDEMRPLADITIAECDKKIRRVYPFTGELTAMAGRGGTDLCPVFEAEFLREHRPDGVVYFTDGQGLYPDRDPGVKTLWVLTKDEPFDCSWGERVALEVVPL